MFGQVQALQQALRQSAFAAISFDAILVSDNLSVSCSCLHWLLLCGDVPTRYMLAVGLPHPVNEDQQPKASSLPFNQQL